MKRIGKETQATAFMRLWSLPESARLENQTLDKLSGAIGKWLRSDSANAQTVGALIRPLLADLVDEEACLEIRSTATGSAEVVLAVQIDAQKNALWEKNLASLFALPGTAGSTHASASHNSWTLAAKSGPNKVELGRSKNWTLFSLSKEKNGLIAEVAARIEHGQPPVVVGAATAWVAGAFDLKRVAAALALQWKLLPEGFPVVSLAVTGDGENVRTSGQLMFPKTVSLELRPWNLPTNLVHDPLVSFTAVRGIGPWLSTFKDFNDLQPAGAPDQVFIWAQDGLPFMTYCAGLMTNPNDFVHRATDRLVQGGNDWLRAHSIGKFQRSTNYEGVDWHELAIIAPFLKAAPPRDGSFAFVGLIPDIQTNRPAPPGLLSEVLSRKDLVYYDWELTQLREDQWLHMSQLMRVILQKAQFPSDSAGMAWLGAVGPKLRNCATVVTKTGPQELTFVRKSGLGLSAVEMHLLADWLESPDFPKGLHTLNAPEITAKRHLKVKPGVGTPEKPGKR